MKHLSEIYQLLKNSSKPLSVSDIKKTLGLSFSSVKRCLLILEQVDLIIIEKFGHMLLARVKNA